MEEKTKKEQLDEEIAKEKAEKEAAILKEKQTVRKDAVEIINKTNEAAERIEQGNAELKLLLDRQEKIQTEATLGGTTSAGGHQQTEEQKADEAAKKQLKGTGFEDILFPEKEKKE